jgi:hypothetical protein
LLKNMMLPFDLCMGRNFLLRPVAGGLPVI